MNTHLLGAVCAFVLTLVTTLAHAVIVPLESRLGGLAYYDPNLDITWAADANAGAGSAFDDGSSTNDGEMEWGSASAWATSLTIGGVKGWRLPSADVNGDGTAVDCSGGGVAGCADNEMGFLYWEEGITAAIPGPFSNVQSDDPYWSGTEGAFADPPNAWYFNFSNGSQAFGVQQAEFFAWAVHDGDVVPIPAASAAVTYQYAGNNYEWVGTQPGILSVYDASMSVQISFEVDSRLISVSGDISHLVTSYVFFDGLHTFTEVNSVLGVFYVRTDSLGNITEWSIEASTIGLEDPTAVIGDTIFYIATQADRYMIRDTTTVEECWYLTEDGLCLWWVNDVASVLSNPGSWSKLSSSVELPPAPDIKINGVDDPPILTDADTIQLSLHLDNNDRTELADWWLVADSPYGYLCWTPTTGWIYDHRPAYQGPLEYVGDFSSLELPVKKFARGRYRIYFGIDSVMDGVFTRPAAIWDSVDFTILR